MLIYTHTHTHTHTRVISTGTLKLFLYTKKKNTNDDINIVQKPFNLSININGPLDTKNLLSLIFKIL